MFWFWKLWLTPTEQRRWKLAEAAKRNLCRAYINDMIRLMFVDWRPWYIEETRCPHDGIHWTTPYGAKSREWKDEYQIYPDDYRHQPRNRAFDLNPLPDMSEETARVMGLPPELHVANCVCIPADPISSPGAFLRMDARCCKHRADLRSRRLQTTWHHADGSICTHRVVCWGSDPTPDANMTRTNP